MSAVLTPNLKAGNGVSDDYDELVEFFEDFERYLHRLPEISPVLEEILVKIMVELLGMLALTMRQVKQGEFSESALNDTPHLA